MGAHILIVEDEQIVAADLEVKLERMGHQVVGKAASGEEAIKLAEELRPELVFMDIRLQGAMDGTTAAQRVRELTGAPVIFVTAYAEVFVADPTQMPPPGICLSKPFSTSQLQAALDSVIGDRRDGGVSPT
jgi:CheY-like chemotaxis protein